MLSPLDEAAVTDHVVKLTNLKPYTTYHFRVISRDKANNLAESEEYTFTTLGEPATFTIAALDISPAEVNIGENITVAFTVMNSGDIAGSYEVISSIIMDTEAETIRRTIDVGASTSERVTFVISRNTAGVYKVDVNGLTGSFTVKETLKPQPKVGLLGITPRYDNKTLNPISTKVTYQLENLTETVTNAELILKVKMNGEQLEDVILVEPGSLLSNDIVSLDYVPPLGWQSGTYAFHAELYLGGNLYASTSEEQLEIEVKPVAVTVSWSTLAMIIGATAVVTGIMLGVILHRRRQIVGNWVEDNRSEPR
jgi:hypothetical protein